MKIIQRQSSQSSLSKPGGLFSLWQKVHKYVGKYSRKTTSLWNKLLPGSQNIYCESCTQWSLSLRLVLTLTQAKKKNRESQECSFPFLISRAWELSWDTKDFNCFCRVGGFSGYHGHKKSKGSESGELKERSFTVPPLLSPRPFSYPQLLCSKVSYKRCFDCSEKPSQTFFFFFLFLLRDESDLTRIIFHHLHSVFFFFFTRRRHVPRHLQRVLPHGVPQPREAEAKECALPTLLQVVPPSCLQGNKDIYLKSAATTFHIVTVWGGWHLTNVEKADHLFITCLFGFLFAQKKKITF